MPRWIQRGELLPLKHYLRIAFSPLVFLSLGLKRFHRLPN